MRPRVEWVRPDMRGEMAEVDKTTSPTSASAAEYTLYVDGCEVAYSDSPELLASIAFDRGCKEVVHNYDLVSREEERNR